MRAGGEAIFFANLGFKDVTNGDFSECNSLLPNIKTLQLNAKDLELPDESFDIVVVQDGLHHLSQPVFGFIEMLRGLDLLNGNQKRDALYKMTSSFYNSFLRELY